MSHYTVAISPAVPRPASHPALSNVRAALHDSLEYAARLRRSSNSALSMGREYLHSSRGAPWVEEYERYAKFTTQLSQTAATRRALHLLYGMLRGHHYTWLEAKPSKNNHTTAAKIRYFAWTALSQYTGEPTQTTTFDLPSEKSIGQWMRGANWTAS